MKHYAVIGRGGSNKRVILASLNDLPQDSHFHLLWTGEEPSPGQETVYDWLIDNEKTFTIYGTNVPKGLVRFAEDVSDAPMYTHLHGMGCDTALILWEDGMDDIILTASPFFPRLLELTNGLTPIEVDDDEDETVTDTMADLTLVPESEETKFFSREELENMPAAAVKRQAKEKGLDISGRSKYQIIDLLLGIEVDEPVEVESTPPVIDLPKDPGLKTIHALIDEIKILDSKIATLEQERRVVVDVVNQALGYEIIRS